MTPGSCEVWSGIALRASRSSGEAGRERFVCDLAILDHIGNTRRRAEMSSST